MRSMSRQFLGEQIDGIWHTAIVVFGREYFYGGGINVASIGHTPYGSPVQQISLGSTSVSPEAFHDCLNELKSVFKPENYNILDHNCNNFSDKVSQFLLGSPIPSWITGLPERVLRTPIGQMVRPMLDQMQRQMLEFHQTQGLTQGSIASSSLPQPPAQSLSSTTTPVTPKAVHRHLNLVITTLNSPTFLITNDRKNLDRVIAKLQSIVDSRALYPTEVSQKHLGNVLSHLSTVPPPCLTDEIYVFFEGLLSSLPSEEVFPALDLLRYIICAESELSAILSRHSTLLTVPLAQFTSASAPSGTRLMTIRLFTNMLASKLRDQFLSGGSERTQSLLALCTCGLGSSRAAEVSSASHLLHNIAISLPRSDSDESLQCLSAVVHHLSLPSIVSNAAASLSLLTALVHRVYCDDDAVATVQLLGLNLAPHLSSSDERILVVAKELGTMINA
eukprot:TRINITY_DN5800_c0_g1_i1.p1 TRINITY_DN5800_c0_g1~~TRINITY_DN5800_c0_g1_i1.p1  ORF type:complete len:447 (-),score=69.42 TRINITY_DN5800_c0_g1_i1:4-1344(-)